ncbi:branched-chain amino acid ABC transporter permease [Labrys monachus]|uniref:Branched-chain amino acid transport system permease protein n=1 Tax=Labrys monachus TaxID=217067 RepID=A0ABU0F7T1_9HYPH|nr:branched-chain amino acid ABC transporter permease [Labrys monachus]MDQ0390496.1 branched-chain amino acid transport system permease protein [Labrys monachus]
MATGPAASRIGLLVAVIVLALAPVILPGRFWPHILSITLIYAVFALGQNVITGWCGMLTLGQAGFAGVGAYTSALLTKDGGVPWIFAFLAAGALSGVAGALLAIPCLRVKSDFLSLVTIAFNQLFFVVANNWMDLTRGPMGITGVPGMGLFGWTARGPAQQLWLMLAVVVLLYIGVGRLTAGPIGRAWNMIRDDETAAGAVGVDVTGYKVLAFATGSLLCGLGGSLYGHYLQLVSPDMFKLDDSLLMMQMAILGGLASLPGSALGALLMVLIPEMLRSSSPWLITLRPGIAGAILVILMIWRPHGLLGTGVPPQLAIAGHALRRAFGLKPSHPELRS